MCYAEDGGAAHADAADCAGLPGAIPQNYDCGRDDYFNPAPAAGSYLATHWNTYDSAFLAPCGEIAPACGGGKLWVPEPPAASDGPGGRRQPAPRLDADRRRRRVEQRARPSYAYQWQRLVARRLGGHRRRDRPAPTWSTSEDLGRRLRVTVVATNPDGSASAASAPTAPIGGARRQPRGELVELQRRSTPRPARPRRPRRPPRPSRRRPPAAPRAKAKSSRRRLAKKKAALGRAQCRDGRVPARQAHPRLAGPARPELRPHGRPDRRAHRRGRDGPGAQPPRRLDRRRGRARPLLAGRRRRAGLRRRPRRRDRGDRARRVRPARSWPARWWRTTSASSAPTPTTRSASTARSGARGCSPATPAGGPGQLEDELAEEAWIIEPPTREEIFTAEPERPVGGGAAPQGPPLRAAGDDAAGPVTQLSARSRPRARG